MLNLSNSNPFTIWTKIDTRWRNEILLQWFLHNRIYRDHKENVKLVYGNSYDKKAAKIGESFGWTSVECPAHWQHNVPAWVRVYGPCSSLCDHAVGITSLKIQNYNIAKVHKPKHLYYFHNAAEITSLYSYKTFYRIPMTIYTERDILDMYEQGLDK